MMETNFHLNIKIIIIKPRKLQKMWKRHILK